MSRADGILKGLTPLHFAALDGRKGAVETLVAAGADVRAKTVSGSPVSVLARMRPEGLF